MTPEETRYLGKVVGEDVDREDKVRLELALGVMRACGARVSLL